MSLIATDIMTREVITAHPDDTVAKIARVLCDHGISAVPICDAHGGVLGMLSEGDLIRPFGKAVNHQRPQICSRNSDEKAHRGAVPGVQNTARASAR
jgi:CBS-domain-containing membrane protein